MNHRIVTIINHDQPLLTIVITELSLSYHLLATLLNHYHYEPLMEFNSPSGLAAGRNAGRCKRRCKRRCAGSGPWPWEAMAGRGHRWISTTAVDLNQQ